MKVPLEWLKEYVAIRLAPEALAQQLTMAGLEVTGIERVDGRPVLDLEITPNRADGLSIIGIAREVSAITGQQLKLPKHTAHSTQHTGRQRRPSTLTIRIGNRKDCKRYIGRRIDGVRISSSPAWMQQRLSACGVRPINNVVDVTNYVLLEFGQPLHAFDFSRLSGGSILVRRAHPNEPITTLDGVARKLPGEALVIADTQQAVAVAGVMGGRGSEVTPQTTSLLLESAWFDPITVRRTARALGLASESSYRFERGVDPVGVEAASVRASHLIQELAGGHETAVRDVGASPPARRPVIVVDVSHLNRWLGTRLDPPTIRTSLARLSCRVASSSASSSMRVTPPSFRQDLQQPVDLYEELARLVGYDRIPATMPSRALMAPVPAAQHEWLSARLQSLRCLCASLGLAEAVTWTLIGETDLARCGYAPTEAVRLANPLSRDRAYVRPSLLPGLLEALRHNVTQGRSDVRLFEVGRVVRKDAGADGATERPSVGIALSGWWRRDWRAAEPADFWVLKGLIEALVERLCNRTPMWSGAPAFWAHAGQAAELRLNSVMVGLMGQVSSQVLRSLDIDTDAFVAELSVEALLAVTRRPASAATPAVFPPAKRDISFLVDRATPFAELEQAIRAAVSAQADRIALIDLFEDPNKIPASKKSLTFAIEYRDSARTLTAEDVDRLHAHVGRTLTERFGATLR